MLLSSRSSLLSTRSSLLSTLFSLTAMNRSNQPSDARLAPALTQRLANAPWWLLVLILIGLFAVFQILTNERSTTIFTAISRGIVVTVRTTLIAYVVALVIGLGVAYGAFESENFRAGIQSIERGQFEAARALGMNYFQTMRFVVLPQAIRRILPTLGNDFIAMRKDSSLVSVLGGVDIPKNTKLYASSTFLFFQAYSILAFIYLTMTVLLSRLVRWMELRLTGGRR